MKIIFICFTFFWSIFVQAKLKIVATTTDVQSIVQSVVGDKADVFAIVLGRLDPHYIEPKPSFLLQLRDADLLVANGFSLEVGWLPSLIRGARNPKINPGSLGYLSLGDFVDPLGKSTEKVTRAMGDVHPDGNPHFTLDPIRVGDLALHVAERLVALDPLNADFYKDNAKKMQENLIKKTKAWQERINRNGVKKVITYHSSMNYFLNRFQLTAVGYLEPRPGISPSAQHLIEIINLIKTEKIKLVLVDNFFETKFADKLAKEVEGLKVVSVGVSVESTPQLKKIDDVIEQLVQSVAGDAK